MLTVEQIKEAREVGKNIGNNAERFRNLFREVCANDHGEKWPEVDLIKSINTANYDLKKIFVGEKLIAPGTYAGYVRAARDSTLFGIPFDTGGTHTKLSYLDNCYQVWKADTSDDKPKVKFMRAVKATRPKTVRQEGKQVLPIPVPGQSAETYNIAFCQAYVKFVTAPDVATLIASDKYITTMCKLAKKMIADYEKQNADVIEQAKALLLETTAA